MSRRTIAPNLEHLIHNATQLGLGYFPDKCRRELRELKSAARALARLVKVGGCGADVCGTYFDPTCSALKQGRRAVARLGRGAGRTGDGQ